MSICSGDSGAGNRASEVRSAMTRLPEVSRCCSPSKVRSGGGAFLSAMREYSTVSALLVLGRDCMIMSTWSSINTCAVKVVMASRVVVWARARPRFSVDLRWGLVGVGTWVAMGALRWRPGGRGATRESDTGGWNGQGRVYGRVFGGGDLRGTVFRDTVCEWTALIKLIFHGAEFPQGGVFEWGVVRRRRELSGVACRKVCGGANEGWIAPAVA